MNNAMFQMTAYNYMYEHSQNTSHLPLPPSLPHQIHVPLIHVKIPACVRTLPVTSCALAHLVSLAVIVRQISTSVRAHPVRMEAVVQMEGLASHVTVRLVLLATSAKQT